MLQSADRHVRDLLAPLEPLHRQALSWFFERSDQIHGWPGKVVLPAGETFLASAPKGIYKPAWTHYALSVRQSLNGPYSDHIFRRPDGTWSYSYFQEGFEPSDLVDKATNRGLMACLVDRVPVGVFRQVSKRPNQYEILGVALVATYDGGFFFLEGAAPSGRLRQPDPSVEFELLAQADATPIEDVYHDASELIEDVAGRQKVFREILRRRGQKAFREQLLYAYEGCCAVSGYDAEDALEAAHIIPYARQGLSTPRNGILLRADVHTLFDLGLLAVDAHSLEVRLSNKLRSTEYADLQGVRLRVPEVEAFQPYREFLSRHASWARLN